jgi:glycosyltransferase involved in cell wall biosynthesis
LECYAAKDERVKVIRQPNGGVARARNRAISESLGLFIAPIDADDLWQPNKIECQIHRILQAGHQAGVAYAWWVWIDTDGGVLDRSPRWDVEGNVFESLLQINFVGSASVPLFRKHCIEEAGGYNEQLAAEGAGGCEDWELLLRIASRYEVVLAPDILLGYRRRPGSMSTSYNTMWRSQLSVLRTMVHIRPDLDPQLPRKAKRQFALYLAGLAFWSGDLYSAVGWGFRSGLRLPLSVAPYVVRMLLKRSRRADTKQTLRPGVYLEPGQAPEPLLPYDKIHTLHPDVVLGRYS